MNALPNYFQQGTASGALRVERVFVAGPEGTAVELRVSWVDL